MSVERFQVRVTPRSKADALEGPDGAGVYKLRLTAPPVDGKANEACVRFFAERYTVPRSAVRIVSGESARLKLIEVRKGE